MIDTTVLFEDARTHTAWQERPVTDDLLRRVYDLAKLGPTSSNCCPMRVVFVKTAEKEFDYPSGDANVETSYGGGGGVNVGSLLPRLAYALNQVLAASKLSQGDAAKVLGVTQPKVSALRHYKLAGFSVERLMNLLTALDQDVEIVMRRKPRSRCN